MRPERWWIVGPGRLGLAWARLLLMEDPSARVVLSGRRPEPPRLPHADRWTYRIGLAWPDPPPHAVLLTVPDGALPEVARALAPTAPPVAVLHCAGAYGPELLGPLADRGAAVGVVHPLAAVVGDPDALRGATYTVEAEGAAAEAAAHLVGLARGSVLTLPPGQRPRYHAAATLAAAGAATVVARAAEVLARAGVPPDAARRALVHLARTALQALGERPVATALTGPAVRGDVATVASHLAELSPSERRLYCVLTRETVGLLGAAGAHPPGHAELRAVLQTACECDST